MTKPYKSAALLDELQKLHPLLIDLSLDRIHELLDRLGRPQDKLPPIIHVAGTNGKGSTIAFLQAMLIGAGKRVHTYTSPHLVRFHERIQLANKKGQTHPISDDFLVETLEHTSAVNDGAPMTFFEITTAAALIAFSQTPADVLLLEVGLGGRLDATNVIKAPKLSVITPVSIDHSDKLGATLELIAFEKAGILKPDIPAVIGPQDPAAITSIKQTAQRVDSPLYCFGQDFMAFEERGRLIFQSEQRLIDLPLPHLIGRNQIINAGVAIAAAQLFTDGSISDQALEHGLQKVNWPARFTRLCEEPFTSWGSPETELWLDGGHNPDASEALAQTLADLQDRSHKPTYLITGMLDSKDPAGFLVPFSGLIKKLYAVPIPENISSIEPEALADYARSAGLKAHTASDVRSAIIAIEELHTGPKRILICGSLHLAGAVLAASEKDLFT